MDGGGALRCSLILFPKVLLDSPIYSSGQLMRAFEMVDDSTFL